MKWYGHMKRMSGERLVRVIYGAGVAGAKVKGRSQTRWLGVRKVLGEGGMTIQQAGRCMEDRNKGGVYGRLMSPY